MNIDIDQAKSSCLRLNAKIVDFLLEHTKDKKEVFGNQDTQKMWARNQSPTTMSILAQFLLQDTTNGIEVLEEAINQALHQMGQDKWFMSFAQQQPFWQKQLMAEQQHRMSTTEYEEKKLIETMLLQSIYTNDMTEYNKVTKEMAEHQATMRRIYNNQLEALKQQSMSSDDKRSPLEICLEAVINKTLDGAQQHIDFVNQAFGETIPTLEEIEIEGNEREELLTVVHQGIQSIKDRRSSIDIELPASKKPTP